MSKLQPGKTKYTAVKIPVEVHGRLKELAREQGKPMTKVFDNLVWKEWKQTFEPDAKV